MNVFQLSSRVNLLILKDLIGRIPGVGAVETWWRSDGGVPCVLVSISMDSQDDWPNGMFLRSRYTMLSVSYLDEDSMTVRSISTSSNLDKVDPVKVTSIDDIGGVVREWVDDNNGSTYYWRVAS